MAKKNTDIIVVMNDVKKDIAKQTKISEKDSRVIDKLINQKKEIDQEVLDLKQKYDDMLAEAQEMAALVDEYRLFDMIGEQDLPDDFNELVELANDLFTQASNLKKDLEKTLKKQSVISRLFKVFFWDKFKIPYFFMVFFYILNKLFWIN